MHEILNLTFSHRANHLITHFYNNQETQFDYNTGNKNAPNDPTVFFKSTINKINKTVSYSPRALLWDLKNGFGSLGKYEYAIQNQNDSDQEDNLPTTFMKQERLPKSDYQMALDSGTNLPELTTENTKYWSDYNKCIFEPKSFNTIRDWCYNPEDPNMGTLQVGQQIFNDYHVGVEEAKKYSADFMDDSFRLAIEECDQISGMNVVIDSDNAWGGFGTEMLVEIRDELPKLDIYGWAMGEQHRDFRLLNRIRSFVKMHELCDLIFPMDGQGNLWQTMGRNNVLFESLQFTCSQRGEQRLNFNHLTMGLTMGTHRKMVSGKFNLSGLEYDVSLFPGDANVDKNHVFSRTIINRGADLESIDDSKILETGTPKQALLRYETLPFKPSDSYPLPQGDVWCSLTIDESPRQLFKNWLLHVSKFVKNDDREDLKDALDTFATEYEHGWYDDTDSDDDY